MVMRFVLALDLVDDAKLIAEYEAHHQSVWPEVEQQIFASGVLSCQIYKVMNRLCMILDTDDNFTFERKAEMDADHEYTQSWEELMWQYQKALPCASAGEKWVLMDKIYELPRQQQQQQQQQQPAQSGYPSFAADEQQLQQQALEQ